MLITSFDHLASIQASQSKYPHIFQLAMDVLPIQATSVPCERAFSSGKETMTPRRSRINPDLMEALQILKYSIRKGPSLSFTEGMSWTDELREIEYLAGRAKSEDPETYGRNLNVAELNDEELEKLIEEVIEENMGLIEGQQDELKNVEE
jgi:hypothetical protein